MPGAVNGWLQAVILGIVQGLTEFLPVSSSGHLALGQAIMGDGFLFKEQAVAFDLVLHIGTLLPVLYYYRAELIQIIQSLFSSSPLNAEGGPIAWLRQDPHRWMAVLVILGTLPTGIIGVTLKDTFESLFHDPWMISGALFVTGILLFSTRFSESPTPKLQLTWLAALAIGLGQGMAITPGISRSGTTIALALLLGYNRALAAQFSFLLSIPAILGAVVLMAKDGVSMPTGSLGPLLAGFVTSMVVGYLALFMLVALVKRGNLYKFAYYLWPVSIGAMVWMGLNGH